MENTKAIAPANIQADESLEIFKQGVDNLLAKRSYFISQVLPRLQEGQDYYIIKGKKSLAKGGAEKLAGIYNLVATFQKDNESLEMLGNTKGLVAFVCNLSRYGVIVGQGRGAYVVDGDPNKAIKMAQKRSFTDSIIRATGISDLFHQDLEDMDPNQIQEAPKKEKPDKYESWMDNLEGETNKPGRKEEHPKSDHLITEKQKKLLISLANQKCEEDEREMILGSVDSMDKSEASHMIKSLIEQ